MIFVNELAQLLKQPSLTDPIPGLMENRMGAACVHTQGPGGTKQGDCRAGEKDRRASLSLSCEVCVSSSRSHHFSVGFAFPPLGFTLRFFFSLKE